MCQASGLMNNLCQILNCLSQVELDTKTLVGQLIQCLNINGTKISLPFTYDFV